jgi:predicted phosphodiesterase
VCYDKKYKRVVWLYVRKGGFVMEQLALIADIHGNLPALEAVLCDIKKRKIKKIVCLGDVIGKGPSNVEVLDICMEKCDIIIKGNWEYYVSSYEPKYSAVWIQEQLGEERVEYIRKLKMSEAFFISGKLLRLFHTSPGGFKRVFMHASLEDKRTLFEDIKTGETSDMVGYADIHRPYMQMVDGRMLFNTGSVGNPLDMTLSSYAILTGELNSKFLSGTSIEFVRVPYDIERAVADAYNAQNLPDLEEYIGEITACKYKRKKI